MAYDPRPDILSKFTDSKVSGTGKYETEYVEIHLRERNPTGTRTYKGSKGLIFLDPPVAVKPDEKSIGGMVYRSPVIINCQMFIPLEEALDYQIDTFIIGVVNSFHDTIVSNQNSTVANGHVGWLGCSPVPSKSGRNERRLMQILVRKYEDFT